VVMTSAMWRRVGSKINLSKKSEKHISPRHL
jgi:hypothetical protein